MRVCFRILFLSLCALAALDMGHVSQTFAAGADTVLKRVGQQAETSVAIDPRNPDRVLVGSCDIDQTLSTTAQCKRLNYFAKDFGTGWRNDTLPNVTGPNERQWDPAVGFDNSGNAWYVGVAESNLFATRSKDLSVSNPWQTPFIFMPQGSGATHDKPALAVDISGGTYNGRLYVSWTLLSGTSRNIYLTYRSPGNGPEQNRWLSASDKKQITTAGDAEFSSMDVAPDGTVYVSWGDISEGAIYLNRFNPVTNMSEGPWRVTGGAPVTQAERQPLSLAADRKDPNIVYVAFEGYRSGRTDTDIFLAKSTNRGENWSAPVLVNWDDTTQTDQFMPWIRTAPLLDTSIGIGRVDIVFYDKRNDPTHNRDFDAFLASSADRGQSIQPNILLSDWQNSPGVFPLKRMVLHYIGIASTATSARPFWTGTAQSDSSVQDIITDVQAFYSVKVRSYLNGIEVASVASITLDSSSRFLTPVDFSVLPGPHTIAMISPVCSGGFVYTFDHWGDGSTINPRALDVQANTGLQAFYIGGTSSCGGSVAYGTLITVSDRSIIPVQNLRVGDQLLMYNIYTHSTRTAMLTEIRRVSMDNLMMISTEQGVPLRVDANPALKLYTLVNSEPVLKSVMELQPGDPLYSYDLGRWVAITRIEVSYGGQHQFYDLLTEPYLDADGSLLSFIANGYADPCETPCKQGNP